jgi:2-oxo-4-hydroxy-4-carboxy-5-ureidoimidazoline decarboxylase
MDRQAALDDLNRAPAETAAEAFGRCCGARAWVDAMVAARPFRDPDDLVERAVRFWQHLAPGERREAFEHHPRIGDRDALRARFAGVSWSAAEQAGAAVATEETLAALERGNREYEERFGHRFIVCATGLGAEEVLARMRDRLSHDPGRELEVASEELMKITRLRLIKLLDGVE